MYGVSGGLSDLLGILKAAFGDNGVRATSEGDKYPSAHSNTQERLAGMKLTPTYVGLLRN